MSRADRTIKEKIKFNRSITPQSEEENTSTLPKIETKKPLSNITSESYNFISSGKKSASSKDSIPGIISKDLVGSLTPQERALVEELAKKIEEQRKEIEQRNHNLMAIQRNFEGLSTMLKKEKELGAENKKKIIVMAEENNKLVEENRILTKRVDDMIERLKKYEQEFDSNAKDKKKINQFLEEQEALKSKIQELQNILERKKREMSDLDTKNKSLTIQIEKLKKATSDLEAEKQQSAAKLKEVKNELENSNKENEKLQKVILEYKVKLGDFDKLKEEHDNLLSKKGDVDKENREFLKEISTLRNEITVLRNQNKKLEEGVQNQNLQLKFGNEKEESLAQEAKDLRKLLEARDAEIFGSNAKINELQKTLQAETQHRLKYKDLIERYETLSKDGSEVNLIRKQDLEKINKELDQLKQKTGDYDEMNKKIEKLNIDITKLNADIAKKNDQLNQYASEKQVEVDKNNKLSERIRALEEENKRYAAHNQKLISALDFKNENEKLKDSQLNSEIESLRQKLEANMSSLDNMNLKHKTLLSEKEQLARQVDTMRREIDSRNREIESLKRKIDTLEAEKNSKLKESDSNTMQLRKELSSLRDQYKALQETNDKNTTSLKKQIEDLEKLNNQKDEQINQMKLEIESITQENKSGQKSVLSLQGEIRELKSTIEIKENQVEAFKKANASLTFELEAKGKEVQVMTKDLKELQEKVRVLTEKNEDLNTKNKEMSSALKELSNDLTLSRLRNKQSESAIEDLEIKLREVMKKLAELDEQKFKEKLAKIEDREKQFNKVIAKIDHAQSSLLISLSCCECMSSLKNPVTLLPCAHNYCEKCVPKSGFCKECKDGLEPDYQYRNKLLEDVIAKVSYNQVILESLKPSDD